MRCFSCSQEAPEGARFCPACGGLVRRDGDMTITSVPAHTPADRTGTSRITHAGGLATTTSGGRFLPGAMIAGRYRVIGLLGKGGMGEVYRADDLTLGQPVALKFLPEELQENTDRLERFLNEVRVARQVSHPNVCRVYDIGEVGGSRFLSMEFVDGEDLSSLLRRIGRLPADKAAQIARQICAGLAAAHNKGIIHRDLKPANVMIDGEGAVRITDFGLAGLAEGFRGAEIRVGTPAYMSPEQLAGEAVTIRSDIYSLGLVLYELYTGKAAFRAETLAELTRMQQTSVPTSPSTLVSDVDPVAERVILRCLEKEPDARPASALGVAAALPGGDPLAAALEAGETPSPEMVAASGSDERLQPVAAWGLLAAVVAGMLISAFIMDRVSLVGRVKPDRAAAVLEAETRELIADLGYPDESTDRVGGFIQNQEAIRHTRAVVTPGRWRPLAERDQLALVYRYRESPRPMVPRNFVGAVGTTDPPPRVGDVQVTRALDGRLIGLLARPGRWPDHDPVATDWDRLFAAAKLDRDAFVEITPGFQPRYFAEERRTWCGVLETSGGLPARIEAATVGGLPVHFDVVTPMSADWQESSDASGSGLEGLEIAVLVIVLMIVGGAIFLAIRNHNLGRGDLRGAFRIAGVVVTGRLLFWLFTGHHVASFAGEFYIFGAGLGFALLLGLATWLFYMAIEPYARKLWPQSLVGWSRILAGSFRDPLVGRELLVGAAFGAVFAVSLPLRLMVPEWFGLASPEPPNWGIAALEGGRFALGLVFLIPVASLASPLANYLLLLILRIVLRLPWLAAAGFTAISILGAVQQVIGESFSPLTVGIGVAVGILDAAVVLVLMIRFGLLATAACYVIVQASTLFPWTLDPGVPYFGVSLLGMAVPLAFTVFAFFTATSGRSLFQDHLLEGEPSRL